MSDPNLPVLYSFRRCPYAMRARMAIAASSIKVRLREVVLRDKPAELREASPKATVPVLALPDGKVLEESLDIMRWALAQADPEAWLAIDADATESLIASSDGPFKAALDRYKYPHRYQDEGVDPIEQRDLGFSILTGWDKQIAAHGGQLLGTQCTFADIALFPFVRQFANTDRGWFDAQPLPALQGWLHGHLESPRFQTIMEKYPQWQAGDPEPIVW